MRWLGERAFCWLARERAPASIGGAAGRIDEAAVAKELLEPWVLGFRWDLMAWFDPAGFDLWDLGAPFGHVRLLSAIGG